MRDAKVTFGRNRSKSRSSPLQPGARGLIAIGTTLLVIFAGLNPLTLAAQEPAPQKLNIVIVEGDAAINNVKLRTAREPIVEVQDENHRPVAGAIVLFTLPGRGAGGVFAQGAKTFSTVTNAEGRAVAQGFQPNTVAGRYQIQVRASYRGTSTNTTIAQRNMRPGLSTTAKILIGVGVVAVGAVVGAVVATRGNGGATPTVITAGPPTVGGPR